MPGSVPLWVLDLLRNEVECVPAGVGVEGGVKGQGHVTGVQLGAFERVLKVLVVTWQHRVKNVNPRRKVLQQELCESCSTGCCPVFTLYKDTVRSLNAMSNVS